MELNLTNLLKNCTYPLAYAQEFKEIFLLYKSSTIIYKDEFIPKDKVGIFIIIDKQIFTYKITLLSSIFSSEAFTTNKAFKLALRKGPRDFTILSGSLIL